MATQRIKTLLVEDNADLADMAGEMLELCGCDVLTVLSPQEAMIQLDNGQKFDFLFTDFSFVGPMNGLDLADYTAKRVSKIKITIATGVDQASIRARTQADYYIMMKPFLLRDLTTMIETLFPANAS